MRPHPLVISVLQKVNKFIPTWRIVPGQDIINAAFRQPEIRAQVPFFPFYFLKARVFE